VAVTQVAVERAVRVGAVAGGAVVAAGGEAGSEAAGTREAGSEGEGTGDPDPATDANGDGDAPAPHDARTVAATTMARRRACARSDVTRDETPGRARCDAQGWTILVR
jgi:hypothetical protein